MQKVNLTDKKCATCRWWRPVLFLLMASIAFGMPSFARAATNTNNSAVLDLHVFGLSSLTNGTFLIDYSFRQIPKEALETTFPHSDSCSGLWYYIALGIAALVILGLALLGSTRLFQKPKETGVEISEHLFFSTLGSVIAGAFWTFALIIMAMGLLGGICWVVHSYVPYCLITALLALSVVPVLLLLAAMGTLLSAKVYKKE